MTQLSVIENIAAYLSEMEAKASIRVLYAVESGSRAWGFASPDSDFDIRFIYVHPRDWYLSVQKRRDVMEAMVDSDLDFAGWGLDKALVLLRKSNPSLIEWLASPIVYAEDVEFMAEFRELATRCLSLNACMQHYLNMATSNWKSYFTEDTAPLKKYLYVLRPIYACRWIEQYHGAPPIVFQTLLAGAGEPGEIADALAELLEAKAKISEMGVGPRRPPLDNFIEHELVRLRDVKLVRQTPVDYEELDVFFRRWVLTRHGPAASKIAT